MIRVHQVKLHYTQSEQMLNEAAAKKLKIAPDHIDKLKIIRKSIYVHHEDIFFVYTLDIQTRDESLILTRSKSRDIQKASDAGYHFTGPGERDLKHPPIIVGAGPAGLFCGVMLARHGYAPIIIERGAEVHKRMKMVQEFWSGGSLDPQCNVQFGEGGAGTFSDGKLNTLVKDKQGRNKKVLEIFVEAGASDEILYMNKPHLGTDQLVTIVENMRQEIIRFGGQVLFESQLTNLIIHNNQVTGIEVNHNKVMETETLVLAIGHSARDTFELIYRHALPMHAKAFAVGVRIEHPQAMIDEVQYGMKRPVQLPAAEYKLTHTCKNGRGVYTFCMCPGGYVVNASSEAGRCAVNGMSYHDRAGENANSAVIVSVTPKDYGSDHALSGIEFQRRLEEACYQAAGAQPYVPVQLYQDFKQHRVSTSYGQVQPQHLGAVIFSDLNQCLPPAICENLVEGIDAFNDKIPGFNRSDALLSGIESRTSSPVRIERDEAFESSIKGIFPCGEGAGYAGGITSAAMDGIKIAEEIGRRFRPLKSI